MMAMPLPKQFDILTSEQMQMDKIMQLINYDYSNVQDLEELALTSQSFMQALEGISVEIKNLTEIKNRNQKEHYAVMEKMTKMQEEYLSKNKALKLKIECMSDQHHRKVAELTESHEKHQKQAESKHQNTLSTIREQIQRLKDSERILEDRQTEEMEFLAAIRNKSADLIEMQYAHHDHMNKQESLQQQQNKVLFLKNLQLVKELKKNVKSYASNVVFEEKELNEEKNYDLKVRLLELQEHISKLRVERNGILKEKNENKINISLNEQQLEQYKVVGSIQKSKIKMYTDKIQNMKKTITTEVGKLQSKIADKKKGWENEMKATKLKLFNLEKEKEQLKISLEKYRVLGETILMQRQEVEQFFLMAIESCKRDIEQSKGMQDATEKQYGQKVDIDELLPKDRHRILTNLYTKLALASRK